MFGGDDEDGDFLSPSGGAKLASLFGLDQESSRGNESFQYTAPKQPRKTSNSASQKPAPPAGAPAVVLATAVQTFRYINGQYVKQGKLGAAVLGNHTAKEYKLLLYLSQQKQVAAAKIHAGFVFTVQPNNYCTFYDDQRQNWSLMFESEKSSSDFCKEVCLAKANCVASLDVAVVQDLSLGEGQAVENGDSLEVVYTGWLLENHAVGQVFDSNQNKDKLLRLRVGAGKVIRGWEEGMLGMKKAGRRFIVIPPNLAYGTKGVPNRIPSNSTLIFEAELRRVKFAKDSGSDRASASSRDSAAPSPAPSPAPSVENLTPEPPVQTSTSGPGTPGETPLRTKSNSLSEQLANPDATKAKLISRMARMGQPMLPFLTGAAGQHESSDSELEDTSASRGKDQPATPSPVQISTSSAPAAAHVHPHPHAAPPSALLPVMTTQPGLPGSSHAFQPYAYAQTSLAPSQLQPVGPVYPAQTVPYMGPSDVTSFLMTEARQHNTEIRLSVGKVGDKVDQLASKIDELQRQGGVSMGVSSMSMETSMMVHNIQRIVQENECLKKEVFEKSSRIEEQNHKIGELINQNQRFMEQSNLQQEKRNDSLKSSSEQNQARLLQAELDKNALPQDPGSGQVQLTEELASSTSRLAQLQLEASTQQQKAVELQTKLSSALQDIENHSQRIAGLEKQLEEVKEVAERTQTQYRSEKQRRKEMELRLSNMEEEVHDLKTDKERLERTLSDRKRKWQAERQRRDEEVEELRRSSQQELDNVRAQLRKARTSTDNAASEQLSQLQVELEEEWKGRSEQMLASAKEKHIRELAELTEQRDALKDQLTQLQEKITAVKHSRDSEEQLQHHRQTEELQALQQKYSALGRQASAVREELERRVAELETKQSDQEGPGDTAAEVKRVMNGVFHSLRGEFDLGESYSGQTVLAVIVTTIKNVTLQLLSGADGSSQRRSKNGEEELEERDDVTQKETMRQRIEHVNGETDVREEEAESHRVAETQMYQKQTETGTTATTDPHPSSSTHLEPQETPTSGSEEERSVPETSTEEEESNKTVGPDTEPGKSPAPETGLETSPPQETGQETCPPQETGQETGPPQQTGQETGPPQQTGQETGPPQETGQETSPPQETGQETSPPKETGQETSLPQETGQETSPPQQTGQETSPPQETGQETSPPQETGQETSPLQENGQETCPPQETGQETCPPQETGQETSPPQETGQETCPPQETGQETCPPQETGQEKGPPQETGQETSPPPESGQITASATVAAVSSEANVEVVDDGEHAGKQEAAPQESFGPPANPPPPPNVLHSSSGGETSLTGGMRKENGEEPFFKIPTPAKPPAAPSEEEDEDEMSLKGRPPPTPLFGDDEDDDDLDWLN